MDLPMYLTEGSTVVRDMDEFKQTLEVLFKNHILTFLQSNKIGFVGGIHESDKGLLNINVRTTVQQIPNTELVNMSINLVNNSALINITVKYKDNVINFKFNVDDTQ